MFSPYGLFTMDRFLNAVRHIPTMLAAIAKFCLRWLAFPVFDLRPSRILLPTHSRIGYGIVGMLTWIVYLLRAIAKTFVDKYVLLICILVSLGVVCGLLLWTEIYHLRWKRPFREAIKVQYIFRTAWLISLGVVYILYALSDLRNAPPIAVPIVTIVLIVLSFACYVVIARSLLPKYFWNKQERIRAYAIQNQSEAERQWPTNRN